MHVYDAVVIGAGQAGLSASYHLGRLGIDHVVLDGDDAAGGAWQHRWDSLTMDDVHGVADLPGSPAPGRGHDRANEVIPGWFGEYERTHALPVARPVRVDRVESLGDLLVVRAGDRSWLTRTLVNATGTWSQPFVPYYPGAATFRGEQLHTVDYPGPEHFDGRRVLVVGGGASAVQFLGELAPRTDVVWVTRRVPVWRPGGTDWDEQAGRDAIALVEQRVRAGLPPASVVSVTGLGLRPQEQEAARLGVYDARRPMFDRIEPDGVRWADPSTGSGQAFEPVDVILWATGFRPAVSHLAPLGLRSPHGGIALRSVGKDVQTAVTAAADPRVQLVGYGPSASTIGGNRAGRAAAVAVRRYLGESRTLAG
ncbi:NAD(P)-binding domain-containing protein [Nocardioides antri]|uniref:NAD(P)/FAD-dependent oxidoreductase n=1 Tax=Nocardioides antri TaxID=2607659 RepID=A0A5B1M6K5_9ACTN|nr:NAD(P)-binding domain-containing protein [Nocardioides antri]KAA1427350.1 NAD(P)/FAD-dependent oxidoreductase [Nocardioides antri]